MTDAPGHHADGRNLMEMYKRSRNEDSARRCASGYL